MQKLYEIWSPKIWLILLLAAVVIMVGCTAGELPPRFSHQGRLLDDTGRPVPDGSYSMRYNLYDSTSTSASPVYTETKTIVVEDGLFTTSIGSSGYITPSIFSQPTYMEITIEGETLTPRQLLQGAPYAMSLVPGAVVRGTEPITRTVGTYTDTGAAFTVWNTDSSATGGNGQVVFTSASPTGADMYKTAALQAIAADADSDPATGAYGARIISDNFRGMYVESPVGWITAAFNHDIYVGGSCIGCAIAYVGQNSDSSALQPGDFVAAVGVEVDPDLGVPVMQVRKATSATDVVVGIAAGSMTRTPVGEFYGAQTGGFDPTGGPAASGEYLSIVVEGLVQANVGANTSLISGDHLTLQSGTTAAALAGEPSFGRLMSEVDAQGFAWVLFKGN